MEIKIDIRTKQAGVMLKTYLERVFAPYDFDFTVGGSIFIMRFKSQEGYDTMKRFLGFLENGFSVR